MGAYEKFIEKRTKLATAATNVGLQVLYNVETVPESYPVAIIVLNRIEGTERSRNRYNVFDDHFVVYLVVDANEQSDPDDGLYIVVDAYRESLVDTYSEDFKITGVYSALSEQRPVRVAKLEISL